MVGGKGLVLGGVSIPDPRHEPGVKSLQRQWTFVLQDAEEVVAARPFEKQKLHSLINQTKPAEAEMLRRVL